MNAIMRIDLDGWQAVSSNFILLKAPGGESNPFSGRAGRDECP
jgi:hypothetical protein